MKENYEALKMEVIAFDSDIWTARADDDIPGDSGVNQDEPTVA